MMTTEFIPYGRQTIDQTDIDAVTEVLTSSYLTQGPKVTAFEQALASQVHAQHAVAANSATSALHLACLALGVQQGDWVWTSPNTFIASANCARYCSAKVDFVDIDPNTYNLCPNALARKLAQAKLDNCLPKVVIPVHFAGQSCDMKAIHQLSLEYGFQIIEDASHAIGGQYQGKPIGDCRYSDICVFSFHPVKIITTGEGGMATTNSSEYANHMRTHAQQGTIKDPEALSQSPGDWYYEQHTLGYNYRMTELQAALGLSQLTKLDDFIAQRHAQFVYYSDKLKALPITLPQQHIDSHSALHLFPILLPKGHQHSRKAIFDALRLAGVGTQVHYIPVHTQPYYQALGFTWGDFPIAEEYYQRTLSLPLFYDLTQAQQDKVIQVLAQALHDHGVIN